MSRTPHPSRRTPGCEPPAGTPDPRPAAPGPAWRPRPGLRPDRRTWRRRPPAPAAPGCPRRSPAGGTRPPPGPAARSPPRGWAGRGHRRPGTGPPRPARNARQAARPPAGGRLRRHAARTGRPTSVGRRRPPAFASVRSASSWSRAPGSCASGAPVSSRRASSPDRRSSTTTRTASSRFLRGMTRAGVSSTGAAARRSRASMRPMVAGASPRNRARSIPLGTTRISPAGMPVAAASSVRRASEIVTAIVARPRLPEQVPWVARVKPGAVAVGGGRHVVVPGDQPPDGALVHEAAQRRRERGVDVEAARVVGDDHVQARRRLAQVPGERVHEAPEPRWNGARVERPLHAPDRGVSTVRQRDPHELHPGIRPAAAPRDHPDRSVRRPP